MSRHRRTPAENILAADLLEALDKHAILVTDLDGVQRRYINGVWVDDTMKRQLRRYRNSPRVKSIRPHTAQSIFDHFNLSNPWRTI